MFWRKKQDFQTYFVVSPFHHLQDFYLIIIIALSNIIFITIIIFLLHILPAKQTLD